MRARDEQPQRELSPLACGLWAVAVVLAVYVAAVVLLH